VYPGVATRVATRGVVTSRLLLSLFGPCLVGVCCCSCLFGCGTALVVAQGEMLAGPLPYTSFLGVRPGVCHCVQGAQQGGLLQLSALTRSAALGAICLAGFFAFSALRASFGAVSAECVILCETARGECKQMDTEWHGILRS
jgi:hypothetical protein